MNETTIKPARKIKETRVSCRVPRPLMRRLENLARSNGMDVSDVVRMSLYRILPEYERQHAPAANGKETVTP